jgi:predicted GNAT family acetyltransferase
MPLFGRLLMACAVALSLQSIHAQPSETTTVYHPDGKRVHVEDCKRLTQDPVERAKLAKMTLAEAKAKGLELCSKCPASPAPASEEAEKAKPEEKKPEEAGAEKEIMVFHGTGKRVHVEDCKRLTQDPGERAKLTKMALAEAKTKGLETCSRCPVSAPPAKAEPEVSKEKNP